MKLSGSSLINQQQIEKLIQHHLKYALFPHAIEKLYRQPYQQTAAQAFRYRAAIVLLLYLCFSVCVYSNPTLLVIPINGVQIGVGIVLVITWLCAFFPQLDRYFDYYASIHAMLLIFSALLGLLFQTSDYPSVWQIALLYWVMISYTCLGLRVYPAMIASCSGGLLAVMIGYLYQQNIHGLLFHLTYTLSNLLGIALAYALDRQQRLSFLQHRLIELSQQKLTQQTAQLEHMSRQDALTGLANRRYLSYFSEFQWPIAVQQQTPYCMMMLDIDYFKCYNDTLGHLQGDECLKKIAQLLQATTLRQNELAVRYGGEEFLLILPHMQQTQAEQLAKYLLTRIHDLKISHPASLVSSYVTISLGLVCFTPQANDQMTDFIHLADQALYQAKHQGRNRYVVAATA